MQVANNCCKWLLQTCNNTLDPLLKALPSADLIQDFHKHFQHFHTNNTQHCFSITRTYDDICTLVSTKPFLARFSVGWVFASIVYHAISILEKQKMYEQAIICLRVLLSTKFCPGKNSNFCNG